MTDRETYTRLAEGNGTRPEVVTLSTVEPERVSWLWPGRIPAGKLTLLVGDPEAGKSTIALDAAACVSMGRPWPDGAPCPRGGVLYLTLEDGLADTIRPRLDAAGADCDRVYSITGMVRYDDEGHAQSDGVVLPLDLPSLETVCQAHGICLLVLDPLKGYMSANGNEWKDGDVRRVLGPLAAFAERTGVAVLAIVHLTKSATTPAQYRVSGSVAFLAAARSVLVAAPDPQDPDSGRRVLAPMKCSLCRPPATLSYTLAAPDGSDDGPAAVVWGGESAVTARQALAPQPDDDERTGAERAKVVLLDVLGDGQPHPQRDVVRDVCRAADVSDRTVRRVAHQLGVVSERTGWGSGAAYTWTLPAHMLVTHIRMASKQSPGARNPVSLGQIDHAAYAGQPHAGQGAVANMGESPSEAERQALQGGA